MSVYFTGFIDLGVGKYCIVDYLVNGCSCMVFLGFFTSNNNFPDFFVKYVGSSPITEGIAMYRSFSPEFVISR